MQSSFKPNRSGKAAWTQMVILCTLSAFLNQCNSMGRLTYFHPSRSNQQLERDEESCRHYARGVFLNRDGFIEGRAPAAEQLLRADIRRDALDECMTEKGWLRKS